MSTILQDPATVLPRCSIHRVILHSARKDSFRLLSYSLAWAGHHSTEQAQKDGTEGKPVHVLRVHSNKASNMNLHREYPDDELIVNYHDACIYGRDLKLLKSPTAWLNDACIHFHLTRLQQNRVGDLFLDPSVVSYFVHQCSDKEDLLDFARGYNNFQGLKRVFVPVNDNLASSNWQTPGMGQHWSLMVIFLLNNRQVKYLHFDSVPGSNSRAAIELARRWSGLWKYLVCTDPKREGLSSTKAPNHIETSVDVLECQAPKQRNGFDCGIHVLFTAESLALDELQDNDQVEAYEQVLEGKFGNRFECDPLFGVALRRRIAEDIIRVAQEANKKA